MILNLAPTRAYHLDTVSSLSFASRTKKIEVSEIENDPVYRAMTKPLATTSSIGGTNINRQPLRPLTAAHNAIKQDTDPTKQGTKPVKAFSVYSDTRKVAGRGCNPHTQPQGLRKVESHKRPAEVNASAPRPFKRLTDNTSHNRNTEAALSKESIDALISRRIDEKLAERALQDTGTVPTLSAELQKRLDDLEHRIDAKEDDEKGQGLQYLLMAKQHAIRGEDTSALRMYQLAFPFFPGNPKLKTKMSNLEERIRKKKVTGAGVQTETESSRSVAPIAAHPARLMGSPGIEKKSSSTKMLYKEDCINDEFAPPQESDHGESYASDDFSFKYTKTVRKPKRLAKKLPVFHDLADDEPSGDRTPRTVHVLNMINSRDVNQIKTLVGVGAKKADTIVSSLVEMGTEDIVDLEGIMSLKGVSW
jgi:hypothetical protein